MKKQNIFKFGLIISILDRREKRQLVFVLLSLLVMGFIELLGVGSIAPFISIASDPQVIHTNIYLKEIYAFFNFASDTSFIIFFGTLVILIFFISNITLAGVNFIIHIFSGKRRHSISMRLFERYLCQPYIFFLNTNSAVLIKNILSDVTTYVVDELICLLQLIASSIICVSIIILLVVLNPYLAIITSLSLCVIYILVFSAIRKFLSRIGEERSAQDVFRYKYINEAFGGIKDIKIIGKEKNFLDLFSFPSKKYASSDAIYSSIIDTPKHIIETIAIGGMLAVIIFMLLAGTNITGFIPVLTVYALGAYRLLPQLQKIFRSITSIRYHFYAVENLHRAFQKTPPGIEIDTGNILKLEFRSTIKLVDISFSYPGAGKPAVKNQNISIKSNTSIVFVGPTGCGKTTLIDIILGLLEPGEGKIFIDNVELNNENIKKWQKNLGYVPQSIYLTDDTIRNNIGFGISEKDIDEEMLVRSAKVANIHNFIINELKNGYDTVIGERGIRLSGGQRQRLGIARAVYNNPSILVLDEATSALDTLTENVIIDAINNLSHKKTIIMVAHRITTVKSCDTIYLMEEGNVTDYGSYDELYEKNHSFRKMAQGI
jgi:ABC-type multidrug transport system fused ATPase/permease subunit